MSTTAKQQYGLTLVEVLIAVILLSVLLVPALDALHTGFLGSEIHSDTGQNHYRLVSRMETLLAEPFGSLDAAVAGPTTVSIYSDPAGPSDRVLVYIAGYDFDNADADSDPFTGIDPNVLWVSVIIDGSVQNLDSLIAR